MKKIAALFITILGSLVLVGYGGDDSAEPSSCPGSGSDLLGITASAESVVESCSATLSCEVDGETDTKTLERTDGYCFIGNILLGDGGVAYAKGGLSAEWKATASTLDICVDGECIIRCKAVR